MYIRKIEAKSGLKDGDEDLKKEDYIWFDFNGEPFVLPIRKVSDIYDNMFMEESKKLAKTDYSNHQ